MKKRKTRQTVHGDARRQLHARLYTVWGGIKQRCLDPVDKNYGKYGVFMCEEWKDYRTFRAWALANGYTDQKSLARITEGGGFCPSNCEWVSKSINTSKGVDNPTKRKFSTEEVADIRASTATMRELSKAYRVSISTIFCVIHRKTYKEEYAVKKKCTKECEALHRIGVSDYCAKYRVTVLADIGNECINPEV